MNKFEEIEAKIKASNDMQELKDLRANILEMSYETREKYRVEESKKLRDEYLDDLYDYRNLAKDCESKMGKLVMQRKKAQ
jgi:hypothetical protein